MRTTRLPAANLNGLIRFAQRPNLVSACVPSRFKRALLPYLSFGITYRSHLQWSSVALTYIFSGQLILTLEDGTDKLYRYIDREIPVPVA